jgi:uncharacterized protein
LVRASADLAPAAPQAPRVPWPPIAPQTLYPPQGGYDPRYDQHGHQDRGYGRRPEKRRKSWLEEIFD